MESIEQITSSKVVFRKKGKYGDTGEYVDFLIWNPTIANLTLMALGSSAPEILLSSIEFARNEFFAGELGPSTIVGSAAFNLLVITAVCIFVIPEEKVRKIANTKVFAITAITSMSAYIWLVYILKVNTSDKVDTWEAVVTLGMFALMLIAAYCADKGCSCFGSNTPAGDGSSLADITDPEAATPSSRASIVSVRMSTRKGSGELLGEEELEEVTVSGGLGEISHHSKVVEKPPSWVELQKMALFCDGGVQEQYNAGLASWVYHIATLFWKVLFLIIPSPGFCGGWPCFVVSLVMIGVITGIVGDMAEMLGCCVGIPSDITAITLVALGTSVPDTLASASCAVNQDTADDAIGNVTGSNAVNVFLGLGLPWTVGAIYWGNQGVTEQWSKHRFRDTTYQDGWYSKYPAGGFLVPAGSLTVSVCIFTVMGIICLALLVYRRSAYGGELGGPIYAQWRDAGFLMLLWFSYIGLSIYQSLSN
jgi:Ca2+/Na+ antiporter